MSRELALFAELKGRNVYEVAVADAGSAGV
jgi:hypothetical protein